MTAVITASLSAKTRKMVPSAMPDASAIWRVVTISRVLEQQREGGVDDRGAPLVGRQGAGPLALDHLHHPGRGYLSERSLTQVGSTASAADDFAGTAPVGGATM